MERANAYIPDTFDMVDEDGVFYILNTLVPEYDGSRIIGPLSAEKLEEKREQYKSIVPEEDRDSHPFIVYRLNQAEPSPEEMEKLRRKLSIVNPDFCISSDDI